MRHRDSIASPRRRRRRAVSTPRRRWRARRLPSKPRCAAPRPHVATGAPPRRTGCRACRLASTARVTASSRRPTTRSAGTFSLRQSLFAGGRQRGVVAEARARAREADFTADRVTGESERDAGNAFTDIAALAKTEATLAAAYTANRRYRDTYVEQFRVSRGTLIELLRAEQDYFAAAASYLQGVAELDIARFTLLARTGEILPAAGIVLTAKAE